MFRWICTSPLLIKDYLIFPKNMCIKYSKAVRSILSFPTHNLHARPGCVVQLDDFMCTGRGNTHIRAEPTIDCWVDAQRRIIWQTDRCLLSAHGGKAHPWLKNSTLTNVGGYIEAHLYITWVTLIPPSCCQSWGHSTADWFLQILLQQRTLLLNRTVHERCHFPPRQPPLWPWCSHKNHNTNWRWCFSSDDFPLSMKGLK